MKKRRVLALKLTCFNYPSRLGAPMNKPCNHRKRPLTTQIIGIKTRTGVHTRKTESD